MSACIGISQILPEGIPVIEGHVRELITVITAVDKVNKIYSPVIKFDTVELRKIIKFGDMKELQKIYSLIPNFYLLKPILVWCFETRFFSPNGERIRNMMNNSHVAEFLLKNGENVNREINGERFAHIACRKQNLYFLRFLLENNANFFKNNIHGISALEIACMKRWFEGLFLILLNIKIKEKHSYVFEDMCRFLTNTNFGENDINKQFKGKTILHLMIKKRNLMAVKLLCQYGANPMIKDNNGISPYKLALNNNWSEEFLLLVNSPGQSKREAVSVRETHKFKWFC